MKTKTFSFATTLLLPFVSFLLSFIFCLLPFIFCLLSLPTTAQAPQSFKYQAALRDDGGKIIANQLVSMRITISNSSGTLYAEEHISTTTDYGLVHLNIGKGHVLSGVFAGIDWSSDEHFMQIEVNTGGGYVDMGTTQLLSVPYALHAGSATSLTGPVSESDPVFTASPSFGITMAHIDNWQSAYSWGDHAMAGYLTSFSEADPLFSLSPSYGIASSDISNWNIAFGWGDHAAAGYLTSFSESDPTWNGAANTGSTIGRTGNVGIGTTSPKALLHTHGTGSGEGNVLFTGSYKDTPGDPPATGAGTRMMWYPDKAAFRAGIVGSYHWDKDSIGNYSVSMGRSTKAIGAGSFSAGWYTSASGSYSVAMGSNSEATGYASTALGNYAQATGNSSTAIGVSTSASGYRSIAMGENTIAQSGYETVIGRYNTDYSPNSTGGWNAGDRLFVIGNGTSSVDRSDAITVLKNGDVGIGTSSPDSRLEISGSGVQRLRIHSSSSTPGEVSIDFLRAGSTNYDWRIRNTNGDLRFSWSNNDLATVNDLITLRHTLGRVGIGTISPLAQLHTTGTVRFAGAGTPGSGKVLTSDAQGNATWQALRYKLGDYAHGGVVFWLDETGMHGLVCAIEDAYPHPVPWGALHSSNDFYTVAYADGIYGGKKNTPLILSAYTIRGQYGASAAWIVFMYNGNNYGDWYMPSKFELNLMYEQRNSINATSIIEGGSAFKNDWYWSSTEGNRAWAQNFFGGAQEQKKKDSDCFVRAIRAF